MVSSVRARARLATAAAARPPRAMARPPAPRPPHLLLLLLSLPVALSAAAGAAVPELSSERVVLSTDHGDITLAFYPEVRAARRAGGRQHAKTPRRRAACADRGSRRRVRSAASAELGERGPARSQSAPFAAWRTFQG